MNKHSINQHLVLKEAYKWSLLDHLFLISYPVRLQKKIKSAGTACFVKIYRDLHSGVQSDVKFQKNSLLGLPWEPNLCTASLAKGKGEGSTCGFGAGFPPPFLSSTTNTIRLGQTDLCSFKRAKVLLESWVWSGLGSVFRAQLDS